MLYLFTRIGDFLFAFGMIGILIWVKVLACAKLLPQTRKVFFNILME
jgi:hypothetical protein